MINGHVALAFDELATLLEIEGESPFKIRAYRNFADVVRALPEPLSAIDGRGQLDDMPGVGKAIAGKVRELLQHGSMKRLDRARDEIPAGLRDLLRVPNLGPGRVRKLWQDLSITTLSELVDACRDGRVEKLAGFAKIAPKLLIDAEAIRATIGRVLLAQAHGLASWLIPQLSHPSGTRVRTAGAVRRAHEIVDELTLVVDRAPRDVAAAFEAPDGGEAVVQVLEVDEAKSHVIARPLGSEGPRVRVCCTGERGFVEALIVETGDDDHVAALQARAEARGTTLRAICQVALDEDAAYAALGLPPIPAELREGGVIEPPPVDLLGVRGVRGIFHVHTTWSDGTGSIVDMARSAHEMGYAYVGISDHSRAASYANGLGPDRLAEQRLEVEHARKQVPEITILHGIEVDVLEDGALDLPDDVLARLDFVVASLHTHFQLDFEAQTRRMVRALGHPLVTILGHPTGRLLLGRPGYTFDLDRVARAATSGGVFLEINASPQRLDLCPEMIRRAAELGARFCINPDAHEPRGFADVPLGIAQARRAALRAEQVFNARDTDDVIAALRSRRAIGAKKLGVVVLS